MTSLPVVEMTKRSQEIFNIIVNNYLEIRVDAWKITSLCRRPFPKPAEDIGTWQTVSNKFSICRNDIHFLARINVMIDFLIEFMRIIR